MVKTKANVVRGNPKSGRKWKVVQTKRSSAMKKGPAFNRSWENKVAKKKEKQIVKEYQERITNNRKQEKSKERKRIEERKKHKEENERKAEVVQVITNMAKLKKIKKKHRHLIQRRDTNALINS